ncbi:MAG: hypothetical protein JWO13_3008 [Acidobacteriales bacterium]|nr:hypothetical protein [Terriglobales bacterium]
MDEPKDVRLSEKLFALLRILHIAIIVMTLFYVGLGEIMRGGRNTDQPSLMLMMSGLALVEIAIVLYIRMKVLPKIEDGLRLDSEDRQLLVRLRNTYTVSFALSMGVAFYGLVLRILGAPFSNAAIFYGLGLALVIFCAPRRPH